MTLFNELLKEVLKGCTFDDLHLASNKCFSPPNFSSQIRLSLSISMGVCLYESEGRRKVIYKSSSYYDQHQSCSMIT